MRFGQHEQGWARHGVATRSEEAAAPLGPFSAPGWWANGSEDLGEMKMGGRGTVLPGGLPEQSSCPPALQKSQALGFQSTIQLKKNNEDPHISSVFVKCH